MIGWILHRAARADDHEHADMKNSSPRRAIGQRPDRDGDTFVSEVDESDGSIAFFAPRIAVVNNISLDHKSMDELRRLFRGFAVKATTVVLNLDNFETAALVSDLKPGQTMTYSLTDARADLLASSPVPSPTGIAFHVKARDSNEAVEVRLQVPGLHTLPMPLRCTAKACGVARQMLSST